MRFVAIAAAAAVIVIGIGGYAFVNMDLDSAPRVPIGPASGSPATSSQSASPAQDEEAARETCSATALVGNMKLNLETKGLPDEVEQKWATIVDSALSCDYENLEKLALAEGEGFTFSYGAVDYSPAEFWMEQESDFKKTGDEVHAYLRWLVQVLQLPWCKETFPNGDDYYIWPRVHCADRTPQDWDDLRGLYADERIEEMRTRDSYFGFRVGILADGDWEYFVAGD